MNAITFRAPEKKDLDKIYQWENDPTQWVTSLTPVNVSRYRIWQYIDGFDGDIAAWHQLLLMIDIFDGDTMTSQTIGMVSLYDVDMRLKRAFVSIFISTEYRGKGYGFNAVERLKQYCAESLNITDLACLIAIDNDASLALFKKSGFVISGTLRSWIFRGGVYVDAHILQNRLRDN